MSMLPPVMVHWNSILQLGCCLSQAWHYITTINRHWLNYRDEFCLCHCSVMSSSSHCDIMSCFKQSWLWNCSSRYKDMLDPEEDYMDDRYISEIKKKKALYVQQICWWQWWQYLTIEVSIITIANILFG